MYKYIIDINFDNQLIEDSHILKIENNIKNNIELSIEDINDLLSYIIYNTNKILSLEKNSPYINKCDLSQAIIGYTLEKLNIKTYPLETMKTISKDVKGHSFLVADFNGDLYLIDNTYRQFFLEDDCKEDKYLIINNKIVLSPEPGFYIAKDSNRINTILPLLEKGFIKLTEDVAKVYSDSFLHTKTNIDTSEIQPNISGKIYINSFLKNTSNYSKQYNELEQKVLLPSEKLDILKNVKQQMSDSTDSKKIK